MKSLRYFFVAVVLISTAKLIEVNFYYILKSPHPGDKEYKKDSYDSEVEDKDSFDKVIESAQKQAPDSTDQVSEVVQEPAAFDEQEQATEESGDSEDNPATNNAQVSSSALTGEAYFQDLKNSYLSPIIASLPEGRSRDDVVIRYYKHENDGNRAYALKSLGYYLHEREAEDNQRLASNSLYYGSEVDLRDIQIVAYTLLKEGMPLKAIKKSAFDWKFNSIEIGADSLVENNSILSVADIQAFEIR